MCDIGWDAHLNRLNAIKADEDDKAGLCTDCHQNEWVVYYNDEYLCEHCIVDRFKHKVTSVFSDHFNCEAIEIKSIEPVIDDDTLTHFQVIAVCDEADIEIKIPMFWI